MLFGRHMKLSLCYDKACCEKALKCATLLKSSKIHERKKCHVYHSRQNESFSRNNEAKNTSSSMIELQAATSFPASNERAYVEEEEMTRAQATLVTLKSLCAFVIRQ